MTPIVWHDYALVTLPKPLADLLDPPSEGPPYRRPDLALSTEVERWMVVWQRLGERPCHWPADLGERLLIARHWIYLRRLFDAGRLTP
jgi:hypothetical protein